MPYMNGDPHIGHAMDYCLADVCARYYSLCGDEVRLQAGTDEHGSKIWQKAIESGLSVQQFVDVQADKFVNFIQRLGVKYTDFVRTTDVEHEKRVQEIWRKLADHIYMDTYEGWYCTGCERFITDKEYEENGGICPDHLKPYEKLKEKNYYFRIADFKGQIIKAIESDEMLILPEFRKKEILRLLAESPDVSISRPREQLEWGVPVPGDKSQVMYVWVDALSNYLTVLGYPDSDDYREWWPAAAQFIGKEILRFHAIIWPAMLIGLGLELPKVLISHGMVLVDGQKMSKTIGNVVDPVAVIEKFDLDAFRYYFLRRVDTFNDTDFTWEKFENAYNNELANDLGNLVQRLAAMCAKNQISLEQKDDTSSFVLDEEYCKLMDRFEYTKAFDYVWNLVQGLNKRIDEEKPWVLAKNGETEKLEQCLTELVAGLLQVNEMLRPFIPATAEKIQDIFMDKKIAVPKEPLFPKH
ncbi:MAG: methionine--tRNA ligase [Candidatus Saccharibacteria bacterium]|nr:methionine--tRNA ligase [Candidatus Saccharibacteria bacterium]